MTIPFMGSARDCFKQLSATYPKATFVPLISQFCKIEGKTIDRWISGEQNPTGERAIRLQVFLTLTGEYRVAEIDELNENLRQLAQAIALDVLKSDNVSQQIGYPDNAEMWRVFRGEIRLSREKQRLLTPLLSGSKQAIEQKMTMWRALLRESLGNQQRPDGRPDSNEDEVAAIPAETASTRELGQTDDVLVIDHLVAALSEMLENGNQADNTDPAPLSELRINLLKRQIGSKRLRRLITQLSMLEA